MANKTGGVEKCRICGHGVMVGTRCPRYDGLVHQEHCTACGYFVEAFHHCRYLEDTIMVERLAKSKKAEEKKRLARRRAFFQAVGEKEASA